MRRFARRTVALTTSAILATGALAGCSQTYDELMARQQLDEALSGLTAKPGLTATLSVEATPEQVGAYAEDQGIVLSPEALTAIADAEMVITSYSPEKRKGGRKKGERGGSSVTLTSGGKELFAFRAVGDAAYARGDVREIARLFGQDPAGWQELAGFGITPPPAFLAAASEGQWISVDLEEAGRLADPERAEDEEKHDGPSPLEQLELDLTDALDRNLTVKERAEGHLSASVALDRLYADGRSAWQHAFPGEGRTGTGGDEEAGTGSTRNDRTFVVDLYVRDGYLAEAAFDAAQFTDGAPTPTGTATTAPARVPVKVAFVREAAPITAPPGRITPVDLPTYVPAVRERLGL